LKAGLFPPGEGMSQRVYMIRRAFLISLGVDAFLLFCLFVISMLPQGSAVERLVFTIFFLPVLYLFLECLLRRVTVDEGGIAIRKLWRKKWVAWEGITHVGGLSIHKKVYILLTTVHGFFIVSNAYGGFSALTEEIISHVGSERVEEEVRLQAGRPPSGIVHIALAWITAAFMAGIILIKMLHFIA
jgi:hypothetical protein